MYCTPVFLGRGGSLSSEKVCGIALVLEEQSDLGHKVCYRVLLKGPADYT